MKQINQSLRIIAGVVALCALLPAHAQYKVVGPDGRITYTDTPPVSASGAKVSRIGERESAAAQAELPYELRQAASRFPVTLYTMKSCAQCDAGRAFLRQRGVPHAERTLQSSEDGDALQRLTGGRQAPTLTIGSQVLTGMNRDTWGSYLDSAGYPRESRLPGNYQFPPATPLTEPKPAAQTAAAPRPAPASAPARPAPAEPPPPAGIKF